MLVISLVLAVAGIVLFIATEDMTQPMVAADEWTLLQAVLAIIATVGSVYATKSKFMKEDETDTNIE
jgi:hypothetical protein